MALAPSTPIWLHPRLSEDTAVLTSRAPATIVTLEVQRYSGVELQCVSNCIDSFNFKSIVTISKCGCYTICMIRLIA
jgi:hypothetical protein